MDPIDIISVFTLPLLAFLLIEAATAAKRQRDTVARIARIDRKLQLVLTHLGVTDPEPELAEVREHLRNGRTVAAVRAYRQATGEGLLAAKQAVDRMTTQP
ncbi:hypothetical protein [Plantactinospora sp. B24E8]|uniref:hypothetical protein n=1 Tax=Plantactinospora sp. B24E8 TaxID=3153567 RepID=UPI00325EF357